MTKEQHQQLTAMMKDLRVLLMKEYRPDGGIGEVCRERAHKVAKEAIDLLSKIVPVQASGRLDEVLGPVENVGSNFTYPGARPLGELLGADEIVCSLTAEEREDLAVIGSAIARR